MQAILIEPMDVISVRDGKSFDAGGGSVGRALWPPPPWTVLGAVRAALVRGTGVDPAHYGGKGWEDTPDRPPESLQRAIECAGRPDEVPPWALGPVLFARMATAGQGGVADVRYPAPEDLVAVKGQDESVPVLARLRVLSGDSFRMTGIRWMGSRNPVRGHLILPPLVGRPAKQRPFHWISQGMAKQWLEGGSFGQAFREEEFKEPWVSEPRIGIAIDPVKGSVARGMLYQRQAFRMRPGWSLLVPILNPHQEGSWVHLAKIGEMGGERRPVTFRRITTFQWPECRARAVGRAALWFLSPVAPEDLRDDALSGAVGGEARVLAVAAGKPISVGGFRMQRRIGGPRAMRRYHPPGTCVYLEVLTGDVRRCHGTSIATDSQERAAGFGVCMVGRWPDESR